MTRSNIVEKKKKKKGVKWKWSFAQQKKPKKRKKINKSVPIIVSRDSTY